MAIRNEYYLDLSEFAPAAAPSTGTEIELRAARPMDVPALAELMIDAYRGTIDYDDETIEDALGEVNAYMRGDRGGVPLLDVSQLAFLGGILVSACLVAEWDERQQPVIAYVMTRAKSKNQGFARRVLVSTLKKLKSDGYGGVRAVITEGNSASEHLFIDQGFRRVSE
jgi:RimJ/RimL family protein N-acetyltransferase